MRKIHGAEAILDKALSAVFENNAALGAEVSEDDLEIDRLKVEIDAARPVIGADDRIDDEQDRIVAEAVGGISAHPERASVALDEIFIAKNLGRFRRPRHEHR